ncbi:MAG: phosphatase PAP2 family protein [Puniceicoccaceae bacterium]
MSSSLRYTGKLFRTTFREIRQRPWIHIAILLVIPLLTSQTMHHDRAWLERIHFDEVGFAQLHAFAGQVSHYSSFLYTPLLYCAVIWSVGWLRRNPQLKRAALICMVAATTGGILVNALRPSFARPRPRAEIEDRFYWFDVSTNMQSFPSGHVMSNMSGAVALSIVQPWLGVPYVLLTTASAWSRMQRLAHYPTDVGVAAILGTGIGIAFARGAMVMRREEDPLETAPKSSTIASGRN